MYADKSTHLLYYAIGDNLSFSAPTTFRDANNNTYTVTAPIALCSAFDQLHAIIPQTNGLYHFIFDNFNQVWDFQSAFAPDYNLPTLCEFNGYLFLAMVAKKGNAISFTTWDNNLLNWGPINSVNNESSWGNVGMFVQSSTLFLVFPVNNSSRVIWTLIYNPELRTWKRLVMSPESTSFGVNATYGDEIGFMGFQENDDVYVSLYQGKWIPHESTGASSADTPSLAVLGNTLNVVINSNNDIRDILWLQRSLANYSIETWMSVIPDTTLISALSIPGTHNSTAISSAPTVGCQSMDIVTQLDSGIRFFDMRCGLVNNMLLMFHGSYPINPPTFLTLASVFSSMMLWLATHPTEGIIVQMKQDTSPINSDISFASAFLAVIEKVPTRWILDDTIPTLGRLRGKIQLVRRYHVNIAAGDPSVGIDLSNWPDNNPNFSLTTPSGVNIMGQDEYEFTLFLKALVPAKFFVVDSAMERAAADTNMSNWYINYTSAIHQFPSYIQPEYIAVGGWDIPNFTWVSGVNTLLRNKLFTLPIPPNGMRYGTILIDFPESEDDLIARVVASNV